jgi:NAD(P)-dependent dehydrogenase (short-subunit alcohol dehydrogenase family)
VAAADIDLAAAQRTAGQAAGNARRAVAIGADCGDVASIDAMVARTAAELGRLDVIVNNAGVTRCAQIMDLTEADWDRIHRVNAKGVFFCLQRAAREMISQGGGGGRIINIASISARGIPAVRASHDPTGLYRDAGVVIPTYCNDTVVRIPPDMDPATDRQLMRQTGRRLADGYLC